MGHREHWVGCWVSQVALGKHYLRGKNLRFWHVMLGDLLGHPAPSVFWEKSEALSRWGSLVCYSPWGYKESETTEWLNWTEMRLHLVHDWATKMHDKWGGVSLGARSQDEAKFLIREGACAWSSADPVSVVRSSLISVLPELLQNSPLWASLADSAGYWNPSAYITP